MKKNGNILIVDDSEALLELITSLLSIEGYSTSTVETGEAAIEFLINNQPDLILLDRTLPGIDGFEVCKQIKGIKKLARIPIIFLTASTNVKEKVEGFHLGAVDYITKPFQKEELLARVNSHFELYKLAQVLKQQTEVLKQSEKSLSDLNATKDKFFSIIAHDLKGPFSNIFELSKLLKEKCGKSDEEEANEIIQHLYSTAENTRNLLENLLEWASIQRGKIEYNPENVNLHSAVSECFNVLMANSKCKSISMANKILPKTTVFADFNMLNTILRNLVSNAIKFTPKGGTVTVYENGIKDTVTICVSDNGVGMDLKTANNLFNANKVQSTYGTEGEQGTGLGLLLCKEFVEKHGGKIWVESEVGVGTKFWFSLTAL
jgi:signal transduction histidine kinase